MQWGDEPWSLTVGINLNVAALSITVSGGGMKKLLMLQIFSRPHVSGAISGIGYAHQDPPMVEACSISSRDR